MKHFTATRIKAAAALAGLSLFLTGCLFQPGNFTSELVLLDDDQFTFTYDGEIHFLGLAKMIEEQQNRSRPEFRAYCYGEVGSDPVEDAAEAVDAAAEAAVAAEAAADGAETDKTAPVVEAVAVDDSYGQRDCTEEEEAKQRAEWEERQTARTERDRKQAESFAGILGGIDPNDPDIEQELASRFERQRGFEKVVAKGDGLFEVSYSVQGTLNHDFAFPTFEGLTNGNAFVQVILRDSDRIRVNAPGFNSQSKGNPMLGLMMGGSAFGGSREDVLGDMPPIKGTFTLVTNGDIRANNTDEGPIAADGFQKLVWDIGPNTQAAPMALIQFAN